MLFFLSVLVLVVSANAKFYTDCGSEHATVQKVSVSGCADDAEECVLKKETNVTFSIDFTLTREVTDVETELGGELWGPGKPLMPLPLPDACKQTELDDCIMPAGQSTSQHITRLIEQFEPPGKRYIDWELKDYTDDNEVKIFCIRISARL